MSGRLGVKALVLVLTCLIGARTAQACYSCSTGLCTDGLVRTLCQETYANNQVYCTLSGDACAGGGGPGHEGGLVAGGNQMTWVVFMTASDDAITSVLPTGRDRVEGEIPGESPSDLLARLSGQSATNFAVSGAVIIYGGSSGSVRTAFGDAIKIRLAPMRGSSSDNSNAGGNGASIVIDNSLRSSDVQITQVKLSGQRYLAIAGVQTYASAATRSIERQELVQGMSRSQQGLSLGLTGE
jgi:hypothetical protein